MPSSANIVWFRHDLRIDDQPALLAAIERGGPVAPVFIWSPEEEGNWPPGAAQRCWLHQALGQLDGDLKQRGARLTLRKGPALECLQALVRECGASAVFWNHRYEPAVVARDERIAQTLRGGGTMVERFHGSLLFDPAVIRTAAGTPFRVFTPFWRKCLSEAIPAAPRSAPPRWSSPKQWPASVELAALALEPRIAWDEGIRSTWRFGAAGALHEMNRFLSQHLLHYEEGRNYPDSEGTSRLSPYLHSGEISPRQVWHAVTQAFGDRTGSVIGTAAESFLRQIVWREFAYHLLVHFPHTENEPLRAEFENFPWQEDAESLRAWQRGQTGYPWVDAGMRQLWETGWMHNRVRMAVASFLVKDLLIPWQAGARWFWDTLVDADLANNTLGWQWTAGCGADAAPYFRIFNPVSQGKKFDPDGNYIRRWIPELAALPAEAIHEPWEADRRVLQKAGVEPGTNYPFPIVDHAQARARALDALARMKK